MRILGTVIDYVHYVHKDRNTMHSFLRLMCRYVAILVYQAVIEDVVVFNRKEEAAHWLSGLAEKYGVEHCADSVIWDTKTKTRIDLGFVSG